MQSCDNSTTMIPYVVSDKQVNRLLNSNRLGQITWTVNL